VRLHHDRAARGQRGSGVAARYREGERKIACAEHRHGTHRDIAQAQVRARQRLAVGHGRIEAQVEPAALADHGCEELQLVHGPPALAFEARSRQATLLHGALDQRVADADDLFGDGLEELRALLEPRLAIGVERVVRQRARALEIGGPRAAVGGLELLARGRIDAADRRLAPCDRGAADDLLAGECDG
jgi:hypothetical protein